MWALVPLPLPPLPPGAASPAAAAQEAHAVRSHLQRGVWAAVLAKGAGSDPAHHHHLPALARYWLQVSANLRQTVTWNHLVSSPGVPSALVHLRLTARLKGGHRRAA